MHLLPLEGDSADEPSEEEDSESDTRSLRAQSLDSESVPASRPFAFAHIPFEGLPKPWSCPPLQPGDWAAHGRPPPLPLPPVPRIVLHGMAERSAHFFCASASFPATSTGTLCYP